MPRSVRDLCAGAQPTGHLNANHHSTLARCRSVKGLVARTGKVGISRAMIVLLVAVLLCGSWQVVGAQATASATGVLQVLDGRTSDVRTAGHARATRAGSSPFYSVSHHLLTRASLTASTVLDTRSARYTWLLDLAEGVRGRFMACNPFGMQDGRRRDWRRSLVAYYAASSLLGSTGNWSVGLAPVVVRALSFAELSAGESRKRGYVNDVRRAARVAQTFHPLTAAPEREHSSEAADMDKVDMASLYVDECSSPLYGSGSGKDEEQLVPGALVGLPPRALGAFGKVWTPFNAYVNNRVLPATQPSFRLLRFNAWLMVQVIVGGVPEDHHDLAVETLADDIDRPIVVPSSASALGKLGISSVDALPDLCVRGVGEHVFACSVRWTVPPVPRRGSRLLGVGVDESDADEEAAEVESSTEAIALDQEFGRDLLHSMTAWSRSHPPSHSVMAYLCSACQFPTTLASRIGRFASADNFDTLSATINQAAYAEQPPAATAPASHTAIPSYDGANLDANVRLVSTCIARCVERHGKNAVLFAVPEEEGSLGVRAHYDAYGRRFVLRNGLWERDYSVRQEAGQAGVVSQLMESRSYAHLAPDALQAVAKFKQREREARMAAERRAQQ
uniref:Uncharacterized protein n=1 Tax=Sexangularia sp. CB-2014 TaxID=1486929 RepID=A0A7S1VEB4_9EUKA|mmetsp:Transcript_2048/g.6499  ORF Transcript_2048/g.6499 Transcript_2048/m.6499 type:complete len:619 (+) Transcript_2048:114-1970(+)